MNTEIIIKKTQWINLYRNLLTLLWLVAGGWTWIRQFDGIQNPEQLPMLCWVIVGALLVSFHFRGYIRFWEALLGYGSGFALSYVLSFAIEVNSFVTILLTLFAPILFESLIQNRINKRLELRNNKS